jgi:hypothetical protein
MTGVFSLVVVLHLLIKTPLMLSTAPFELGNPFLVALKQACDRQDQVLLMLSRLMHNP